MTRIVLTDTGAKVRAFLNSRPGLTFESWKDACVVTLTKAVGEDQPPGSGLHVIEVHDQFVQVCLDRNIEPGAILSEFMSDMLDLAVAAEGAPTGVSEGSTEEV